jgi:hypothetical protein
MIYWFTLLVPSLIMAAGCSVMYSVYLNLSLFSAVGAQGSGPEL